VSRHREAARLLGTLLSVGLLAWILHAFANSDAMAQLRNAQHASALARGVAAGIPIYAIGVGLLGVAWWLLQRASSSQRVGFVTTEACYAVAQFGKYVPGNVAHYAGRHTLLHKHGLSHASLVVCALLEAALLVCAALAWGAPLIDRLGHWLSPALIWGAIALGGLGCLALLMWMPRLRQLVPAPAWLLPAVCVLLLFFALMGTTLYVIAAASGIPAGFLELTAVAALSWAAGYLVVGAPAGLGVREATFLILLRPHVPEGDVLLLAAGFRAATFGGDLLAFLCGLPAVISRKRP